MHSWVQRVERDFDRIQDITRDDRECGPYLSSRAAMQVREILQKLINDAEEVTREEIRKET